MIIEAEKRVKKIVSKIILTLLVTSILTLSSDIQLVRASGTIYIRADGSIDPPAAPISTVDYVTYTFTANIYDSIVVQRNNIVVDGAGYTVHGTGASSLIGVDLSHRTNVTIKNMGISGFLCGIILSGSSNNWVLRNDITANGSTCIVLSGSSGNSIVENNITGLIAKFWASIDLENSNHNNIVGNNITPIVRDGIALKTSNYNTISGNSIANGLNGITLWESSGNTIVGNNIENNNIGVYITQLRLPSGNNVIVGNNITRNSNGVMLYQGSGNIFYHNNFIENSQQVYMYSAGVNIWDNGYPSGGNYWSDYTGEDADGDGIGDTPYTIDSNNQDNYPLMYYASPPLIYSLTITTTGGATNPPPETYSYVASSTAQVAAISDANSIFDYWILDGSPAGSDNPITILMDGNHTLKAVFVHIGPFYIRADGSVDPLTAPIHRNGDLYTLIGNITSDADGIVIERDNIVVDGAGYTVQGSRASGSKGITLSYRNNVAIKNMVIREFVHGIYVSGSHHIIISRNNITANSWNGILLLDSSANTLDGNNITATDTQAIYLTGSSYNTLTGNSLTDNFYAIIVAFSSNNIFSGNNIANNWNGIQLSCSSSNTFVENSITANTPAYGIWLSWECYDNIIFHNNIEENAIQTRVEVGCSGNLWDNGYPSGGNYWDDYLERYPSAGEIDYSGIWDTPYVIEGPDQDNYPLMYRWPPIETSINVTGTDYPATVLSNTAIEEIVATANILSFTSSGPDGEVGRIRVIFPMVNTTEIKVFIDGVELVPPPFPTIDTNGTHYFIYFEFVLSTHDIAIQFAPETIEATIDIVPSSLNLQSIGVWITAYIELPEGYNIADIDVSSIILNNTVWAEATPIAIGDYDGDTVQDLMVKFSRASVVSYILTVIGTPPRFSTVTLIIKGTLIDGTSFEGSCTIKIIA